MQTPAATYRWRSTSSRSRIRSSRRSRRSSRPRSSPPRTAPRALGRRARGHDREIVVGPSARADRAAPVRRSRGPRRSVERTGLAAPPGARATLKWITEATHCSPSRARRRARSLVRRVCPVAEPSLIRRRVAGTEPGRRTHRSRRRARHGPVSGPSRPARPFAPAASVRQRTLSARRLTNVTPGERAQAVRAASRMTRQLVSGRRCPAPGTRVSWASAS
jgi:hypothetical protein